MAEDKKVSRKKIRQSQQQLQTDAVEQIADEALESISTDTPPTDPESPVAQMQQLSQEDLAQPRKRYIIPHLTSRSRTETNSVVTEILLFGVVLMAITSIVAGLLGLINSQTAPIIAGHESAKRQTALEAIFPDADQFINALDETTGNFAYSDSNIESVYVVYDNNDIVGYCVSVKAAGYSSTPIELMVGSDLLNKVTAIQVVNHSETPGIGETVISSNEPFFQQFTGQSRPIEFSNQITAVSGATFTSEGIKNGVNAALGAIDEVRLEMAQPGGEG